MKKVCWLSPSTLPLCAQVKITPQGKDKVSVEIDGKPFTDFYIGADERQAVSAPAAHGRRQDRHPRLPDGHRHPGRSARPSAPSRAVVHARRRQRLRLLGQRGFAEGRRQRQGHGWCWNGWIRSPRARNRRLQRELRMEDSDRRDAADREPQDDVLLRSATAHDRFRHHAVAAGGGHVRRYEGGHVRHTPGGAARRGPAEGYCFAQAHGQDGQRANKSGEKNVWGKRVGVAGLLRARSMAPRSGSRCSTTRRTRATPTYWHTRGYGLLANNIFGVHDFESDQSRDASLTIRPGQPLRFRYRVIIHPGDVNGGNPRRV